MPVPSQAQREKLAPVEAYFDGIRCQREERSLADARFIESVWGLVRAEGQDQTEWAERRCQRLGAAAGKLPGSGQKNGPDALTSASASSRGQPSTTKNKEGNNTPTTQSNRPSTTAVVRGGESAPAACLDIPNDDVSQRTRLQNSLREAPVALSRPRRGSQKHRRQQQRKGKPSNDNQGLDVEQAITRVAQLKSIVANAADPPKVAAEMAALFLMLPDHASALKSFRLAVKPSPELVPTKEEVKVREMQQRKLMLLNEERRAEALADLEAQEEMKRREREIAEKARRKEAAAGIFRCLLDLKQPVAAARAARVRLGMCETEQERRKAELDTHETLLRYDGLLEAEATNQGAWLTESAGALSDLHASVLESLSHAARDDIVAASTPVMRSTGQDLGDAYGMPESLSGEGERSEQGGRAMSDGGSLTPPDPCVTATEASAESTRVGKVVDRVGHSTMEARHRGRLRDLGRLLARKRQFTASRQAFDDAMRGGGDEMLLRKRNEDHTRGFFLDMALDEASPLIRLRLDSRWQGGVEADEARRRALANFTGFTGVHRGAETLVTAVPAGGWADGLSDLAYADRFSRSRAAVYSLQGVGGGGGLGPAGDGAAGEGTSGVLLRHIVPAKDVVHGGSGFVVE